MSPAQSWMSSLILEPGELVVRSWFGNYETETRVVIKSGFGQRARDVKSREGGIMVLTNQRVIWLEAKGTFGKSYHTDLTIPLEDIKGVSLGGSLMKFITLTDSKGAHLFHLHKESGRGLIGDNEFPVFRQMVTFQMTQRKSALESQRKQERVHMMLDFSFLRQYMEKGGLVLQIVKCSNCGASMQMPQSGNSVECSHCRTTQHVEDIFQKVKQLIG